MDRPNPELMRAYGTEPLMKEAKADNLPMSAKVLAALLGFGTMLAFSKGVKASGEEKEQQENLERAMEAQRMKAVMESMKVGWAMNPTKTSPKKEVIKMPNLLRHKETYSFRADKVSGDARDYVKDIGRRMAKHAFGVPVISGAAKVLGAIPGKGKILKGGLLLGGGVGAYKGMSALSSYAQNPKGGKIQRWGARRPLMQNVSEYGYPVR